MSVRWLAEAWEHSPQEGGTLLVLLALADYANDAGECWPSVESIGLKARLGHRQVLRALGKLEESGELERPTGPRSSERPYRLRGDKLSRVSGDTSEVSSTTQGGDSGDTSIVEPSGTVNEPPAALPGLDDKRNLIETWAEMFGKHPSVLHSPSRLKAAERALKEADYATLVTALGGARNYRARKKGSTEFTDIFGTFRGTGDLASRIAFFVEQADTTQVAAGLSSISADVPSGQREMVRERQRHVEAWLRTPGDENLRGRGELAALWLQETLHLVAVATQVGDAMVIEWSREDA